MSPDQAATTTPIAQFRAQRFIQISTTLTALHVELALDPLIVQSPQEHQFLMERTLKLAELVIALGRQREESQNETETTETGAPNSGPTAN